MRKWLRKLWRVEGTVGRATYAIAGFGGFALKFAVDWSIAHGFGQPWRLLNYWHLIGAKISRPELIVLLLVAVPFIWFGVTMSLLRSRDAGVPALMVLLFFVPVLNLIYFLTLCALPSRHSGGRTTNEPLLPAKTESMKTVESAVYSVLITAVFALACAGISTWVFQKYGMMLFVGLPFCIGFSASLLHGWRYPRSGAQSLFVAVTALLFVCGALLAVAWEGIICLLMAFPIALVLTILGAFLGYAIQRQRPTSRATAAVAVPMLLPLLMGGDAAHRVDAPLYEVRTSVDIDAPAERVWPNVIGFGDITESPDWLFRAGVAYPLRARIRGSGVGATRYCIFTTGAFVEPIELWDPPRHLRFGVTANPAPMRELTLYDDIRPPHLDGYLVSRRGEFVLQPLSGGRTRLIGRTWYQHHLAPAGYWRLWSDAIIHRIHTRVLRHIRRLSETSAHRRAA
jgi:hypothetical protein